MKKWIVRILIVIAFIGLWYYGESKSQDASTTIEQLTGKVDSYKTKYDQLVESKESVILENDDFKFINDSLRDVISKFKEPETVTKYKWRLKTDTMEVLIPVYINDSDSLFYDFIKDDGYNIVSGTVSKSKIKINPIEVNNELSIVSGYKKRGFFKKKRHYIDISNSNPYIQTKGITTFHVQPKKSWHEKWWVTGAVGVIGGILISN